MGRRYLRNTKFSVSATIKVLGEDYFNITGIEIKASRKINLIEKQSSLMQMPSVFGELGGNKTHYLLTVDLFMESCFEMEHRKIVIENAVLERLSAFNNFLDIGVGKGELSKYVGRDFYNVTVIDMEKEYLDNFPIVLGKNNNNVTKINLSILDVSFTHQYDLILFSHTLYYIAEKYRIPVVDKLYESLNIGGILCITYNDRLGRSELVKDFGGRVNDFDNFFFNIKTKFENITILESQEIITSKSLEPMMHIANLMLYDAGAKVEYDELKQYLESNFYSDHENDNSMLLGQGLYQIDMVQNFIIIIKS